MEEEIWKDIPGFENIYQASNLGRIKSLEKIVYRRRNGNYKNKEMIMNPSLNAHGYLITGLTKNKKIKTYKIHSIIAITFLNHIMAQNELVIDHIDNNKLNNSLSNLQLITNRENLSKDKKNKTSKYTGVHWHKGNKKWQSSIRIKNKRIYLGVFDNEIDAHNAYKNKLKSING